MIAKQIELRDKLNAAKSRDEMADIVGKYSSQLTISESTEAIIESDPYKANRIQDRLSIHTSVIYV